MKTHFFLHLVAAALAAVPLSSHAQGQLLARHSGGSNPTTEGFSTGGFGDPMEQAVTNDLGLDAWSIRISAAGVNYRQGLPDLGGLDWKLSVILRVVEGHAGARAFYTSVNTGQYQYFLHFGMDPTGDPIVRVSGVDLSPILVLEGAGSTYHKYELVYKAASNAAALRVDGIELLQDISGRAGLSPLLQFGGTQELVPPMQANWNLVSLEIIPEPSALALLGVGGAVLAVRLFRRRLPA